MLFQYDTNKLISVYRRNQGLSNSQYANIFNEPEYGTVTTNWQLISASLPVLFDEIRSPVQYLPAGERLDIDFIIYATSSASIEVEDRVFDLTNPTTSASMYVVTDTTVATDGFGLPDHMELNLRLP